MREGEQPAGALRQLLREVSAQKREAGLSRGRRAALCLGEGHAPH